MFRSLLGQVLKLLARNVEANLHLFAQDGCSPTSANGTAAAAAAATTEAADATLDDSDSDNDGSAAGGRDRRGGDRPGKVAAVRELDWFTFSQEEGPTDSAICPQVGERKVGVPTNLWRLSRHQRLNFTPFAWWLSPWVSNEGSVARSI